MKKYIVVLSLLTLIFSCGGKKAVKTPSGADTIPMRYPSDFYIVRTGHGETPEEAAENARFEIVKYFESRISGETVLVQKAKSAITRGKLLEDRLTELTNEVTITGERDIPGIDIVKNAKTGTKGVYEAVAALSKQEYASYLGEKIGGLDAAVDQRLAEPHATDLETFRALAKSARDIAERETYRRDMTLVAGQSAPPSRETLFARVAASMDSLIAGALDIGVVFGGQIDDKLRPGILKGITDTGIRIREYDGLSAAANADCDLILSASVAITQRITDMTADGTSHTLHWSDWILSLTAIEPVSKEVIDTVVLTDRISGLDAPQASDRMTRKILDTQTPAIASWLYDSFFAGEKK